MTRWVGVRACWCRDSGARQRAPPDAKVPRKAFGRWPADRWGGKRLDADGARGRCFAPWGGGSPSLRDVVHAEGESAMTSEKRPTEKASSGEPAPDGEAGGARDSTQGGSGTARLSPALTRAIVEQLLQHGRELGRREMIDLVGSRYGWKREVSDPDVPAPASLDA